MVTRLRVVTSEVLVRICWSGLSLRVHAVRRNRRQEARGRDLPRAPGQKILRTSIPPHWAGGGRRKWEGTRLADDGDLTR